MEAVNSILAWLMWYAPEICFGIVLFTIVLAIEKVIYHSGKLIIRVVKRDIHHSPTSYYLERHASRRKFKFLEAIHIRREA